MCRLIDCFNSKVDNCTSSQLIKKQKKKTETFQQKSRKREKDKDAWPALRATHEKKNLSNINGLVDRKSVMEAF